MTDTQQTERPDFWLSSGHHLLDRSEGGGLVVTDEFIKAYLARPELMPPPEACPVERGVHASLLENPRLPVTDEELAAIQDADARENIALFLAFRDVLLAHSTLEQAYLSLFKRGVGQTPPLFLQQLTHVIARNAFDPCSDPFVMRAAECFFRPQRVTVHEKSVLLADFEAIESHEENRHHSPLMAMLGGPAVSELTILNEENADSYWVRSDAHDLVFNLTDGKQGRKALAEAMRLWVKHLTGMEISFKTVETLADETVAWFVALDVEGTRIGNMVWNGAPLDEETLSRVLALYRFTLPRSPRILSKYRGKKSFALMGMTHDRLLMVKPQNLVAGLPLAEED